MPFVLVLVKQIDRRTKISGAQWKSDNVPQVLAQRQSLSQWINLCSLNKNWDAPIPHAIAAFILYLVFMYYI